MDLYFKPPIINDFQVDLDDVLELAREAGLEGSFICKINDIGTQHFSFDGEFEVYCPHRNTFTFIQISEIDSRLERCKKSVILSCLDIISEIKESKSTSFRY